MAVVSFLDAGAADVQDGRDFSMHSDSFLQDLAVVMLVAGLVTVAFRWLRQPVVLGYILAGAVIGPHLLPRPLVASQENIRTLAELGVVFLLFRVGLEFNFRKLRQIGRTALIVAPLETALLFVAGFEIGQAFGWTTMDSVYLGGVLMISSTTIITKTLAELGRQRETFAEVIYGVLIVEDVIAIVLLASLSGVSRTGHFEWGAIAGLIGRLFEFITVAVVLGLLVIPRLLRFVGRFRQEETLLVTVLGLCFGFALLAERLGFSAALGAFIMGALMAESDEIRRIERHTAPLRDMFSAVFFVAIGMLIDPTLLRGHLLPVLSIVVALVLGKLIACSFGTFLAGYDRATALRVGLGMGQIGEFSFIIAALGSSLGVTGGFLYPVVVGVSAVTTVLTPYMIRHSDKIVSWHDRFAPASLLAYQQDYREWVERVRLRRAADPVRRLVRTMLIQLGINIALMAGFFIAAVFIHSRRLPIIENLPPWTGGAKTVLWIGALLLSLPVMLAFVRKLQAFGMLLSEMAIGGRTGYRERTALRALLANTILIAGSVVVSLLLLVLSAPMLPPREVFLLAAVLAGVTAILLRTSFVRIYSRAQTAIRETLARPREPLPLERAKEMPPLLEEAELLTVGLGVNSPAVGSSIEDLRIRSRTGATVVVVRRGEHTKLNPEPSTVFCVHDQLLLVGDGHQLERARKLLTGE